MRRIKSIIARGALCIAILTGSPGLASACGNDLVYLFLFRAYSEAGRAYDAELVARRAGELSAEAWSADLGLTYHQWSLARAQKVLDRLAVRLHRTTQAGDADVSVSIMLADEVYVAELHTKSRDVALKPLRMGHPKSNINLYTTANALRALINGRVGWQDAVKRDLVVLTGSDQQQQQVSGLLSDALSVGAPDS